MSLSEKTELYPLAAAGAIGGVWKYYVKPELTAKRGWAAIGAAVLAYELSCPPGELLSEGVDRALERNKALTSLAVGVTALHLLNVLPEVIDPYSQSLKFLKRL